MDLEGRVAALEMRVDTLSERLQMEAGLAAARDRDVSDMQVTLRSHTAMLQALQERQAEQGQVLAGLVTGQAELVTGQAELRAGMGAVVTMLTTLIERETE